MVTLSTNNSIVLDNLLYDAFGGLQEYAVLQQGDIPIQRLIRYNDILFITKAWSTSIDLEELGLPPGREIVIYNDNYNEIQRFPYSQIYGEKDTHVSFINNLKHGQQYYLRLDTVTGPRLILCIAARELPSFKRKRLIQSWIQQIEWDVYKPISSEAFFNYLGQHNMVIYYLPINYTQGITLDQLLASPDTERFDFSIENTLVLLSIRKGFYAIGKEEEGFTRWLRVEDIVGTEAESYVYQNGINYLGRGLTNNLSINISTSGQQVVDVQPTSVVFSVTGSLVDAFDYDNANTLDIEVVVTESITTSITAVTPSIINLVIDVLPTESITTTTGLVSNVNTNLALTFDPDISIGTTNGLWPRSNQDFTLDNSETVTAEFTTSTTLWPSQTASLGGLQDPVDLSLTTSTTLWPSQVTSLGGLEDPVAITITTSSGGSGQNDTLALDVSPTIGLTTSVGTVTFQNINMALDDDRTESITTSIGT